MNIPPYRPGNRLISGSTRSGKSTAEVIDILAAALAGMAVVVIDPHMNSLAWNAFVQSVGRGLTRRVLFDRLSNLSRILGYRFLRPSRAVNPFVRRAEHEQTTREFCDVLMRRRDISSLAGHPQTEEFVMDALDFIIEQNPEVAASKIEFAYQPHHKTFRELLRNCTVDSLREKFTAIAENRIKAGMYAPAARLIRSVCRSPAFTLRCEQTFDLNTHLDARGILLVGGANQGMSADTASTIMGSIILLVINYIRARRNATPRVLLVVDEATNANLIGAAGHEVRALAELQKKGLDVHVLVQSPTFANAFVEDGVFTSCIEHHWFFAANDTVARKAAQDLGDPYYRSAIRELRRGERYIKRLNTVTFDRVTPLPPPWPFTGLSERKAYAALGQILQRPEYWTPTCREEESISNQESNTSSTSPIDTSASPGTSSPISPVERLRTARSRISGNKAASDQSDT